MCCLQVHTCLYFIAPSGHGLKPLDIEFMRRLHDKVNIIPVISKADTLTPEECQHFKKQVLVKNRYLNNICPSTLRELIYSFLKLWCLLLQVPGLTLAQGLLHSRPKSQQTGVRLIILLAISLMFLCPRCWNKSWLLFVKTQACNVAVVIPTFIYYVHLYSYQWFQQGFARSQSWTCAISR